MLERPLVRLAAHCLTRMAKKAATRDPAILRNMSMLMLQATGEITNGGDSGSV